MCRQILLDWIPRPWRCYSLAVVRRCATHPLFSLCLSHLPAAVKPVRSSESHRLLAPPRSDPFSPFIISGGATVAIAMPFRQQLGQQKDLSFSPAFGPQFGSPHALATSGWAWMVGDCLGVIDARKHLHPIHHL